VGRFQCASTAVSLFISQMIFYVYDAIVIWSCARGASTLLALKAVRILIHLLINEAAKDSHNPPFSLG
jgi:hypothetical protein